MNMIRIWSWAIFSLQNTQTRVAVAVQVYTNYTHMECSGRFPSLEQLDASLITSPEFRPNSAFMRTLTVQMLGHNWNCISRPTTLFITHKISHTARLAVRCFCLISWNIRVLHLRLFEQCPLSLFLACLSSRLNKINVCSSRGSSSLTLASHLATDARAWAELSRLQTDGLAGMVECVGGLEMPPLAMLCCCIDSDAAAAKSSLHSSQWILTSQ